jgi:ABC-type transporter Mla subunit MlaD
VGLAVNDERLALRVGAGLLALVALAAVLVVLFDGFQWRSRATVYVYFARTGNLKEGADFQVASRIVGEVSSIQLVSDRVAADPSHPLHPDGGVVCEVKIDERYLDMTTDNGEVFVSAKGVIGTGYLELGAPAGDVAPGEPLRDGARIRGVDPPEMDRVLMRSYQNLLVSRVFLAEVAPEGKRLMRELRALLETLGKVEPHPGALGELADAASALGDDIDRVLAKWDQTGVDLADVEDLMTKSRATLASVRRAVAELDGDLTALQADLDRLRASLPDDMQGKVERAIAMSRDSLAKLERIQATVQAMLAMVERGEGNIGGLTNDPEFADYAKKIGKALKRTPWKIFGTDRGPDPRSGPRKRPPF